METVENIYRSSKYVMQLSVYADMNRDFALGIVVPNAKALTELAKEKGLSPDIKELCLNEEIEREVVADFRRIGEAKRVPFLFKEI